MFRTGRFRCLDIFSRMMLFLPCTIDVWGRSSALVMRRFSYVKRQQVEPYALDLTFVAGPMRYQYLYSCRIPLMLASLWAGPRATFKDCHWRLMTDMIGPCAIDATLTLGRMCLLHQVYDE